MMKLLLGFPLLALAAGCSSKPSTCSGTDVKGTYLLSYKERASGTCGALPDVVGVIPGKVPDGYDCKLDETLSNGKCTKTTQSTCKKDDGTVVQSTVVYTQQDDGGDELVGLFTVTISGTAQCTSTYDVTAIRQ